MISIFLDKIEFTKRKLLTISLFYISALLLNSIITLFFFKNKFKNYE